MPRPKSALLLLAAGGLLVVPALLACAKSPPEAHSAPSAQAADKASGDTTVPPGVDISKLDDFQKKVFFRVSNSETSLCGQAQSLLASAKKDCRKSVNGLRYVVRLVEQGYTDSEITEAIAKRYRAAAPRA